MKKILLLALLTGFSSLSHSQKENNIWYFGDNAGLDFSSGTPVALTNGKLMSYDNTATMSDHKGNLLFYTEGIKVWNKNHMQMPNGFGLFGNLTGGQPATIVPKPCSSNIYYIFTGDAFAGPNGLNYSIVDMNQQGGLGDVTTKNMLMLSVCSEKITAVQHGNNVDFWLVTHAWNSNSFYAYLVSSAGVSNTPVVSSVGSVHTGGNNPSYNAMGQITISPDRKRLAVGIHDLGNFEIFDFNASTGQVSNPIIITNYSTAWGVQFSPNSSKLYTTRWGSSPIYQFDLKATNVANSVMTVGNATSPSGYKAGYLQTGPDKKIYVAKFTSSYLGIINNPDSTGLKSNFVDNGFYLAGKICEAGLSNTFNILHYNSSSIADSASCMSDSASFTTSSTNNITSVSWTFGDPSSANNTSSKLNPKHLYSSAGSFTVKAIINTSCGIDSLTKNITINQSPTPIITISNNLCSGAAYLTSNYVAGNQWSYSGTVVNGANDTIYYPTQTGFYGLKVTDSNGCTGKYLVSIVVKNPPNTLISPSASSICKGDPQGVTLTGYGSGSYLWSTGDTITEIVVNPSSSTTYKLTVTDAYGCTQSSTAFITVNSSSPTTPTIQQNGNILASSASTGNQWYLNGNLINGATGQFYTATTSGFYTVKVTVNGCSATSTPLNVFISGINEQSISKDLVIFPNPNSGSFTVMYNATSFQNVKVNIFNTIGELIYSKEQSVIPGTNNIPVQLEMNAAGIYFIKVQTNTGNSMQKLVVN
jgi:PKD repeat protein